MPKTFDSTASNKTQEVFGLKENSRLNLKNAKIVGGDYGVFVHIQDGKLENQRGSDPRAFCV